MVALHYYAQRLDLIHTPLDHIDAVETRTVCVKELLAVVLGSSDPANPPS